MEDDYTFSEKEVTDYCEKAKEPNPAVDAIVALLPETAAELIRHGKEKAISELRSAYVEKFSEQPNEQAEMIIMLSAARVSGGEQWEWEQGGKGIKALRFKGELLAATGYSMRGRKV
jgi:hypothetical protein